MRQQLKHILFILILTGYTLVNAQEKTDSTLKVWFNFNSYDAPSTVITNNSGNNFVATLKNEATIAAKGGIDGVLNLGSNNGFLDLGAAFGTQLLNTLDDFTLATYICISNDAIITNNGNFIFSFGNSEQIATDANGCMFFSAKSTQYAISLTNWSAEQALGTNQAMEQGKWKHLAISYNANSKTVKIYINGVEVASSTEVTLSPKALGTPAYNFIGKSSYALNGDAYLQKTLIDEFRVYNVALPSSRIVELGAALPEMNAAWYQLQINNFLSSIAFTDGQLINADIALPTSENEITITWNSSDPATISNSGEVVRPASGSNPKEVMLTATAVKEGITAVKTFRLIVIPSLTDSEAVTYDTEHINLKGSLDNLRSSLVLPASGFEGSTIGWSSSVPDLLTNVGHLNYLPEKGTGKTKVVLTATIAKGGSSVTRLYDIYVAEKEGFSAYLFAYFTGNSLSDEALRFAISNDGFTYKALNNNNPVLSSTAISSTGGIRDPHILRGKDGQSYYMVATDMVSANGWNSNRAMILMKSSNLVDWQTHVVNIQTTYPGYSELHRVWAPQTIYDPKQGKYMVYWAMQIGTEPDKIYYAYANSDFSALEGEPKILFQNPNGGSTIDADIVYKDEQYHLFFKTEGEGFGIKKAVSDSLTGNYVMYDKYLQSTTNAVEGGCVFRMYDTDTWILMYDMYTSGAYQFTESTDLENFSVVTQPVQFNFTPRHGTIIPITNNEAAALMKKWGNVSDIYIQSSASGAIKKNNVSFNQTAKTIYLPVRYGTDITNFNPQFLANAGCTVTPSSGQDFSKGAVNYTASINGLGSKTYAVTVEVNNNPVLEGYYADPEILYSYKEKKFYLYPTTDGFVGWAGYYFKPFSSPDLVNWTDEGTILNLHTDVSWGTFNAWAPSITEKKVDGVYKYFYYFVAAGNVGVAVADEPTGPFVDSGKKLADNIDPDVYSDTLTGKSYLYWGNSTLYAAELNDDMVSINESTKRTITPSGGTFREGVYVIQRNGTYYFFWSENDTRSPDYRVRYGTSTSPLGPITVPANNLILAKDATSGIYGPGHNSVVQIPGRDEWYIVYHRFTRPKGITMQGDSAGYFREVCIDKLEFNTDGSVKKVIPNVQGIAPVKVGGIPDGLNELINPNEKKKVKSFPQNITRLMVNR
ncbi:MAG: family 43 glycosylhydrolase [Salinivirgaceae bacterium]